MTGLRFPRIYNNFFWEKTSTKTCTKNLMVQKTCRKNHAYCGHYYVWSQTHIFFLGKCNTSKKCTFKVPSLLVFFLSFTNFFGENTNQKVLLIGTKLFFVSVFVADRKKNRRHEHSFAKIRQPWPLEHFWTRPDCYCRVINTGFFVWFWNILW